MKKGEVLIEILVNFTFKSGRRSEDSNQIPSSDSDNVTLSARPGDHGVVRDKRIV